MENLNGGNLLLTNMSQHVKNGLKVIHCVVSKEANQTHQKVYLTNAQTTLYPTAAACWTDWVHLQVTVLPWKQKFYYILFSQTPELEH